MKLNTGEIICSECDGKGSFEVPDYEQKDLCWPVRCEKCKGNGKLDWIENITGVKKVSSLDKINMRRLKIQIEKSVQNSFKHSTPSNTFLKCQMEAIMNQHMIMKTIYDYKINVNKQPDRIELDISIKPNRAIEHIQMNVIIKGDEV